MKLLVIAFVMAALVAVGQSAPAAQDAGALEDNAEIYHDPEARREAGLGALLDGRIAFGGLIEVELSYVDGEGGSETDAALATVELGLDVAVNDWVSGSLVFLFEQGDTEPMALDVGSVTIGNPDASAVSVTAGRLYPPFGSYYSHFITDPLTLELGELQETAVLVGYEGQAVNASITVFRGDVGDGSDLDNVVLAVSGTPIEQLELGASYITNVADSDGLQEEFAGGITGEVSAYGLYAILTLEPVQISAEYVAADAFAAADLDADEDGAGDQPSAWNIEVAWDATERLELAARIAGSDELLDLPEESYGVDASYGLFENTSLGLEWMHNELPGGADEDTITAQLGVEF